MYDYLGECSAQTRKFQILKLHNILDKTGWSKKLSQANVPLKHLFTSSKRISVNNEGHLEFGQKKQVSEQDSCAYGPRPHIIDFYRKQASSLSCFPPLKVVLHLLTPPPPQKKSSKLQFVVYLLFYAERLELL